MTRVFNRNRLIIVVALTGLVFTTAIGLPKAWGSANKKHKTIPGQFKDLAFLEGHWSGTKDGLHIDELWTTPRGDTMMGTARVLQSDKTIYYAMQSFTQVNDTLVFRPVHLLPDLNKMPNRNEPLEMQLISRSEKEAVFEKLGFVRSGVKRFTFKGTGRDQLIISLHTEQKGKLVAAGEYRYKRLP